MLLEGALSAGVGVPAAELGAWEVLPAGLDGLLGTVTLLEVICWI